MFQKILSPSLSPNTDSRDVLTAIHVLLQPWKWKEGEAIRHAELWFENYFQVRQALSFNSGRSALYAILKAFDIGKGDEVLVQAFTCVAVPNSVHWTGAKPVYVDIDTSYNMDPGDVQKKITKGTKALIIQHTFGIPAQIDRLAAIAKKYNLYVIEDCAHSLGGVDKGKKIGTFGDAAFFSFGRDKVVSSVWGGMAIMSAKLKAQSIKLKKYQKILKYPSYFWIVQQLLHPIAFAVILPLYTMGIGKVILWMLQRLRLLSFPVYKEERYGGQPAIFPQSYPNGLAEVLLTQLEKLEETTRQRKKVAALYYQRLRKNSRFRLPPKRNGAVYLRFPIEVDDPRVLLQQGKQHGVLLGNWYHNVIDPEGVVFPLVDYQKNSCPKAEYSASRILNIPTMITDDEVHRILTIFR